MNPLGIVLAFAGSFMQGVGNLLQKKAQAKDLSATDGHFLVRTAFVTGMESESEDGDDDEDSGDDLAYVKSPLWRLGFAIFLSGSILGFFAVGLIGPSLLVVISSSSLLTNVLLSPIVLKESRRVLDWVSVFLIILGISLAITAMEMGDKQRLTVQETVDCIRSKRAASTWTTLSLFYIGTMLLCRLKKKKPENKYVRATFAVRAGVSGVVGVMLATPTSLLLQNPTAEHPILFVLAACLILQVVLDVHIQNRSLKFNDMMFHGPVTFVVCWYLFMSPFLRLELTSPGLKPGQMGTLVASSLVYNETRNFDNTQWIIGAVGCASVAAGVGLSASRPFPNTPGYMVITSL